MNMAQFQLYKKRLKALRQQQGANIENILYDSFDIAKENTFTILTSSYNKTKYLNDWAFSILKQKYRPLNIVFVDDASTEVDSKRIMSLKNEFRVAGIGLRIIRNSQRCFCASSYKTAHKFAIGHFYGVVDADDMLLPDAVTPVMKIYKNMPDIAFVYTQFQICDSTMQPLKVGFCLCPPEGYSMLDMAHRRVHTFSHWRTFSSRLSAPTKIWKDGLTCAVDKYMAYRMEEMGKGIFINKVCYAYRQSIGGSISAVEKTKLNWFKIQDEARNRRRKYNLTPYQVKELAPDMLDKME